MMMSSIFELVTVMPAWTVICIMILTVYVIVKVINWIKNIWQQRQSFKQAAIEEGEALQKEVDEAAVQKALQEQRIQLLEDNLATLTEMLKETKTEVRMLIESDKLGIKAWIKDQHEKWTAVGCIDSQSLELICQRYEIYQREKGNSWAETLMKEIKALPVITVIPLKSEHKSE